MSKWTQIARQFLGRQPAPAPSSAQAPASGPTPAEMSVAAETPAPTEPAAPPPLPPWKSIGRQSTDRLYPRVVDLPDGQGYVLLRFYPAECHRTLMTPLRLPLPQGIACLPGPLFAMGDVADTHCGPDGTPGTVQRCFRYVLPPILYSTNVEMETILLQTHQDARRLMASANCPSLPVAAPRPGIPEEPAEPSFPADWVDYPPIEVPPIRHADEDPPSIAMDSMEDGLPQEADDAPPSVNHPCIEEWTGTITRFQPKGGKDDQERYTRSPLLFIKDEALGGQERSISGKDLLRAMAESKACPGDRVWVRHTENVPLEVHQSAGRQQRRRAPYMKMFQIEVLEKGRSPGH